MRILSLQHILTLRALYTSGSSCFLFKPPNILPKYPKLFVCTGLCFVLTNTFQCNTATPHSHGRPTSPLSPPLHDTAPATKFPQQARQQLLHNLLDFLLLGILILILLALGRAIAALVLLVSAMLLVVSATAVVLLLSTAIPAAAAAGEVGRAAL